MMNDEMVQALADHGATDACHSTLLGKTCDNFFGAFVESCGIFTIYEILIPMVRGSQWWILLEMLNYNYWLRYWLWNISIGKLCGGTRALPIQMARIFQACGSKPLHSPCL